MNIRNASAVLNINSVSVVLPAILFSSFTIILIPSWIKYPLFLFEVSLIVTILVCLNGKFQFKAWRPRIIFSKDWQKIFTVIFIVSSILLLLVAVLQINLGSVGLVMTLITASFLSGYSLLKVTGTTKYFSSIEIYVLSFIVSFIFLAFMSLLLLPISEDTRPVVISSIFLITGMLSLYKQKYRKTGLDAARVGSLAQDIDLIPILITLAFYTIFFFILYPGAALLPGSDISRHINDSLILSRSPELYTTFSYLFFHAFELGFYTLSGIDQPVFDILSSLIILNIFLPLAVYALAKRFLPQLDKRIPSISLLFYALTSNFSFLYYTQLSFLSNSAESTSYTILARDVAEKSYFGIVNFLQPFHFFVPLSVSMIIFITVFLLLRNFALSAVRYISIFSILLITMYFVHVVEAVLFASFLAIFSFFSRTKLLRLGEALVSSAISFSVIGLALVLLPIFFHSELQIGQGIDRLALLTIIVPLLLLIASMVWRWKVLPNVKNHYQNILQNEKTRLVLSYSVIVIYLFSIILWVFIEDFKTSTLSDIGIVPWFIYPIMLGIVGLLAILAMRFAYEHSIQTIINFLIAIIGFLFIVGKLISYVNVNILEVNYWEKRFVLVIFLFCSLLAPIPLVRLADYLSAKRSKNSVNVILAVLVSSIIISGFSSMAIQLEYWYNSTSGIKRLSGSESEAVSYLKNILQKDKYAFTASPTDLSRHVLAFAAPAYHLSRPDLIVSPQYPAVPLLALTVHNLDHAYIYMHSRDYQLLNESSGSWLAEHLLPALPVIFSNDEVKIFNASSINPPSNNSDTLFLIPERPHTSDWLYAYDILSHSRLGYTEGYQSSYPGLVHNKNLVIPEDPNSAFTSVDEFYSSNKSKSRWTPIAGSWSFISNALKAKGNSTDSFDQRGIILSPTYSPDGVISTLFRLNDIDPTRYAHISVIKSWLDKNNYEFAGIAVRLNEVYAYFGRVLDGHVSFEPSFPYLPTGLKFKPGTNLNLTLSSSNKSQDLFINGTKYLQHEGGNNEGLTGLTFSRVKELEFDEFKIKHNSTGDQDTAKFFRFIQEGGNLYVINTNGYGEIANLVKATDLPIDFTRLTKFSLDGQPSENINLDQVKYGKQQILSALDEQSLFLLKGKFGKGNLIYINLHPLMLGYAENYGPSTYNIIRNISKIINAEEGIENIMSRSPFNIREVPAFFEEMNSTGIIQINSNSIVIPQGKNKPFNVEIFGKGGVGKSVISDSITINSNSKHISFQTSDLAMTGGKGLYSNLVFSSKPVILLPDSGSTLEVESINGSKLKFIDIKNLTLSQFEQLSVYAKQPSMNINGEVNFKGFDGERFLYSKSGIKKTPDITFIGELNSSIVASDQTSLLGKISLNGSFASDKLSYNELIFPFTNSFAFNLYDLPVIVRALLLIPFMLAVIFLFYRKIF